MLDFIRFIWSKTRKRNHSTSVGNITRSITVNLNDFLSCRTLETKRNRTKRLSVRSKVEVLVFALHAATRWLFSCVLSQTTQITFFAEGWVICVTARVCVLNDTMMTDRPGEKARVQTHPTYWRFLAAGQSTYQSNGRHLMGVCVCISSGCILGPDGGFGGGRVPDGAGVRLPASQMWRGGLGACSPARRPLPAFRHPALWAHCYRGYYSVAAHTAAHPRTGVYTQQRC